MGREKTAAEKRAELLIKYRNLAVEREEQDGNLITYYLSKEGEKIIMHCLNVVQTIGISYIRDLKQVVDKEEADKGILVGEGKYTYSAKSSAPKLNVELIPPTLPTFDIFEHELVPKSYIINEEEKQRTNTSRMIKLKTSSINPVIDLRGLNLDEALLELDKYLDDAFMSNLNEVQVIHGKGMGILREGITQFLKKHKHVKESRLGTFNEGGDGVTIVTFK